MTQVIGSVSRQRHRGRLILVLVVVGAVLLVGVAALLVALALGAAAVSDNGVASSPHDTELISSFAQHRSQFALAAQQFASHGSVDGDLLKTLGIEPDGALEYPRGVITFAAASGGITDSGFSKGYAYSKQLLRPLVKSTDRYAEESDALVYRHIEGPWYVYYEHTN